MRQCKPSRPKFSPFGSTVITTHIMATKTEQWIERFRHPNANDDAGTTDWILTATSDEIRDLIQKTTSYAPFSRQTRDLPLLKSTLETLPQWSRDYEPKSDFEHSDFPDAVAKLYHHLVEFADLPRQNLLMVLATLGGKKNLDFFCELIVNDPPKGVAEAATPFLPLFNESRANVCELVFPQLLDGLENPNLAPAILDLSNFLTRSKRTASHPAAPRIRELIRLLDGLATGLLNLQTEAEDQDAVGYESIQRYSESIALVVSLCDALALIGDLSSVEVLTRLFKLKHRRIHVETAAALARLGQQNGRKALAAMAAEPAVRLRVVNYADELGMTDDIDAKFREPVAIAEAELVAYLAEPTCMGVPPTSCALVDTRTLYWPGYEEPRICYLFRYTYRSVDGQGAELVYNNLGIAGPLVHTFRVDLGDRTTEDVYSAFAGWQTEHDEIYQTNASDLQPATQRTADQLRRRIEEEGYQQVTPVELGSFFGDKVLIAEAVKLGETAAEETTATDRETQPTRVGTVIADGKKVHWFPRRSERSIDCDMAYNIYKGRRLLEAFNGQ